MSVIEEKSFNQKEQIKPVENNSEKQIELKNKEIENLKKESIYTTKELLKKLLEKSLNNSLLKLESNTANHISSLKATSKSFDDLKKIINNLIKNVEETKKKKDKDKMDKNKKSQIFKKSRNVVTEHHLKSRSRTIESNLLKFKNKLALGNNDNNKKNNNNTKNIKKFNLGTKKIFNRTYTYFRLNEDDKTKERLNKFQNAGNNTNRDLKKNNNIKTPITPHGRIKEKFKYKDMNNIQNDTISLESFTNKPINKIKKIDIYEKNNISKSTVINHLSNVDERIEKNAWNKTKKIKNKEIKGIIYKNDKTDKKSIITKLNNQLDTITEKKNKVNNSKIHFKSKEKDKNELENIAKLVDNVNQNLNKILSDNKIRRNSIKVDKNNKLLGKRQENNSKSFMNAVKDVNIKENENDKIKNKEKINNNQNLNNIDSTNETIINNNQLKNNMLEKTNNNNNNSNNNNNNDNINNNDNDNNNNNNDNNNDNSDNNNNDNNNINININNDNNNININININKDNININNKNKNKNNNNNNNSNNININNININNIKNEKSKNILKNIFESFEIEKEDNKILSKEKKRKSLHSFKCMNKILEVNDNKLKYNKSFKEIIKSKNRNEIKKEELFQNRKNNEKVKDFNQNEIIINNKEIIKKIRLKMKEKVDKINIKNKHEIKEKELLNEKKENSVNNPKINIKENDQLNNSNKDILLKINEDIKNSKLESNLNINKSEKKIIKFNINNNLNLIKKSKSFKNNYK